MTSKNYLNTISLALGILSILVFLVSSLREWVYFQIIGSDFISMISPSDYTGIALSWLPKFLLPYVVVILVEMIVQRGEHFLSEDEIIQRSKNPERVRFHRKLPQTVLFILIFLLSTFWLIMGFLTSNPTLKFLPFAVAPFWFMFCQWFASHPRSWGFLSIRSIYLVSVTKP